MTIERNYECQLEAERIARECDAVYESADELYSAVHDAVCRLAGMYDGDERAFVRVWALETLHCQAACPETSRQARELVVNVLGGVA
jgi:hypothetical protein